MDITLGQVVHSKAGRDAGKIFIIVGIIDQSFVLISDGNLRRIESPKRKKIKHLEFTGTVIEPISEKFRSEMKVTNSEIRKALAVHTDANSGSN